MGWKEDKQAASFRGVPFLVEASSGRRGRRTVLHEYPKRDVPMVEDMGLATRDHKFSAWVGGDDCLTKRDALLKVLEEPGAGELVHPWYGRLMVVCTGVEVSHSEREGGIVRFDLEFIKGEASAFPVGSADSATRADLAASTVQTSAQSRFSAVTKGLDMAKAQSKVVQGKLGELRDLLDEAGSPLRAVFRDVRQVYTDITTAPDKFAAMLFSVVSDVSREFGGFGGGGGLGGLISLQGIFGKASSARRMGEIQRPAEPVTAALVNAVVDLVRDATIVDTVRDVSILPDGVPPRRPSTVTAVESARDTPVSVDGSNGQVLPEVLLGGQGRDLPVLEDVRKAGEQIREAIWSAALDAKPDHYEALTAARVACGRHLDRVGLRGLRLKSYAPISIIPSLVLAYREYADATRAGEIVTRNRVEHPGFLPARELKLIGERGG
ncbi:DNA circularization protein [Bordetella bronchiseptica]|uniref:DNA circularization protein n=1 Tax=Bordetella bronchiseptica TaxID=518 RepID=UPI000528D881|nr:DNA circularization N-terminal domain-containing protein [Bordetella bronchiseptica]